MGYKTIAIREEDYERIEAAKIHFESTFQRRVSWTEFLLALSLGYMMGWQIMENEDRLRLEVER